MPSLSILSRSGLVSVLAALSLAACNQQSDVPAAAPATSDPVGNSTAAAPVTTPLATTQTCASEIGAEPAKALVDVCLQVSPATRPPCNVENPCQMIRDEIKRGCDMLADGEKPAACAA